MVAINPRRRCCGRSQCCALGRSLCRPRCPAPSCPCCRVRCSHRSHSRGRSLRRPHGPPRTRARIRARGGIRFLVKTSPVALHDAIVGGLVVVLDVMLCFGLRSRPCPRLVVVLVVVIADLLVIILTADLVCVLVCMLNRSS